MILPRKAKAAIDEAVTSVKAATSKVSGYVITAICVAVLALIVSLIALVGVKRARIA